MKAKTSIITGLLLASLVLLASCEAEPAQPNGQLNANNGSIIESTTQPVEVNPANPAPPVSAADQAAYNGAMELKDPTYCVKIADETYREACKTTLSDLIKNDEAVEKMDSSLCAGLSTADKQEACKTQVEVLTKKKQEQDQKDQALATDQDKMRELIKAEDYAGCRNLTEEAFKFDCETNILVNKAVQTKDASWCDKASLDSVKELCRNTVAGKGVPVGQ